MYKIVKFAVLALLFLALIITKCTKKSTPPEPPEFEVSENLRVVADTTLKKVSSYEEGTLVFSEPSQQAASLSKGDIIVGGISDVTPNGFLLKVTYISSNKDTIKTSQASFEDMMKKGHIEFKKTLDPNEASSFKLRKGVSVDEAGDLRFNLKIDNVVLYDADGNEGTKDDQVVLNGYIYFNSDLEFEMEIDDWKIQNLIFQNTIDEKVELDLDSKVSVVDYYKKVRIADYSFPSFVAAWIPTPLGVPVPVTVTPNLEVNVGLDGKVHIETAINVTQEAQLVAGLSYENSKWSVIKDFSNEFKFDIPTLSSNLDVKAFAGPQLNLLIYGVAGPSAEINGYAELEADIDKNPWWTLVAGLEALLGVRAKIFGHSLVDHHEKVIGFEKVLAEAGPLEDLVASLVTIPDSGIAPLDVLLDASGSTSGAEITQYQFVFGDGTQDYVESKTNNDGSFDGKTNHTYDSEGTFTAGVTVKDKLGRQDSESTGISVKEAPEDSVVQLTSLGGCHPAWSPDGKTIAFCSYRDGNGEIYVMNADGSSQTNISNSDSADQEPDWSPDGTKITFSSFPSYSLWHWEIWVINADGSNKTKITENSWFDYAPAWSPDGEKIAFTSKRDGNPEIYVMDADGTNQTRLTYDPHTDSRPDWSPDGKKLVFYSGRSSGDGFWVINADGTNPTMIMPSYYSDYDPTWSPDGKRIAFWSIRGGGVCGDVYVINADGTNEKRLTNNPADDREPAWSPDGKKIAFCSDRSDRDGDRNIYVIRVSE